MNHAMFEQIIPEAAGNELQETAIRIIKEMPGYQTASAEALEAHLEQNFKPEFERWYQATFPGGVGTYGQGMQWKVLRDGLVLGWAVMQARIAMRN